MPHLNPKTGLSTDYLNHFTEALMVLELAGATPECLDDLRAWRPRTYVEHFAASRLSHRDEVITAYQESDPDLRRALDLSSRRLNVALTQTCEAVMSAPTASSNTEKADRLRMIRLQIARIAALINGRTDAEWHDPQAAVDAMLTR